MSGRDIAIIGLDISLPNCQNQDEVWHALKEKRISKGKFSTKRLAQIGLLADENKFIEGSYFEEIDQFDHKYFNISQKSAEYMDPNQRLSLLSATKALNNSGYLERFRGSNTGVYASVNSTQQYQYLLLLQEHKLRPDLLGMLNSTISSRINYIFDLKGPSIMTDTACSSSLVSVIQACNDLGNKEVDAAVVVSSNLYVKPGYKADKLVDILAEDAKTKTFDERSTGTSMGEGVCSVILKRLEDAERDGDYIYGVIKNYAINNDGQTMNMSSPNPLAQEKLIEEAWAPLMQDISKLSFIEAHGTGTAVGDTIEFESLNSYFLSNGLLKQSVALTACKSNFGHLDVASGLFSLIKSVLSLKYKTILPHPDFKIPNEEIDFEDSIFYIPDKGHLIEDDALAGISSFGMTGTNTHVVLQRYDGPVTQTVDELNLHLRSYWFPLDSNSFSINSELQISENEKTVFVQFPLNLNEVWEVKEHRFNKKHLMVGTSFLEIISQGLSHTIYSLENYDFKKLYIVNQLAVQEGKFTVLLTLEKEDLKGELSFNVNGEIKKWIVFELIEKSAVCWRETSIFEDYDLEEVTVTNQVGESDEEDIVVSQRWNVVDRLWVDKKNTKALVKLTVPEGYGKEFELYNFYPSILDPAFNALNRMAEPDEILFPWHWNEIQVFEPHLKGTEFFSEIQLKERTSDDIGNVILSLDIRLFDSNKNLILIANNYKVKNSLEDKENIHQTLFKQELFKSVDFKEERNESNSNSLFVIHESMREKYPMSANVIYFKNLSDLKNQKFDFKEIQEVFFWDKSYCDESIVASEQYELGQFLLRLNQEGRIQRFNYISTQIFGYAGMNALNRSIAMGTYSLRLELNFKVRIIDTDNCNNDISLIDFKDEDFIVHREQKFYIIRFKNLNLNTIAKNKFKDSTVLIVGGRSGIGLEYTKYLLEHYKSIKIIIAGRQKGLNCEAIANKVQYVQLDITSEELIRDFSNAYGNSIDYILNFAGEAAEGLFVNKGLNDFYVKTKSKINGSFLLQKYFTKVKEIIHFSSLAGLIGAIGQTEYCMANAYQSGLPSVDNNIRTLNLTGWQDVGMSANKEDYYFEKLHSSEGVILIDRFVQSEIKQASMFRLKIEADNYSSIFSKVMKVRVPRETKYEDEKDNTIEHKILKAWENTLGDDEYDYSRSFFEQGGDSITIVHLCDELNKLFPDLFDVTTLFSISTLAGQIELVKDSMITTSSKSIKDISFDAKEMLDFLSK